MSKKPSSLISKPTFVLSAFLLIVSCATYKPQKGNLTAFKNKGQPTHTFFIAGGLGNAKADTDTAILYKLKSELTLSNENSTLIFTGDIISEIENNWAQDKKILDKHLELTQNFKGNTLFIPGNNEWKGNNTEKVEQVEDYIKDKEAKNLSFFPENACPIEHRVINDDLDVILIDSKWFVSNWSRVVNMNQKCTDIVTRRRFMEELEGYINDGQGKNIVIAMHHPIFSNGTYAGNQTFADHMKPLPILGTVKEAVMDLGAFDPEHVNSRRYNYLRVLVSALAQSSDRITIVSGHEESLQYLTGGGIHQIISGSLGSKSATHRSNGHITAIGGSLPFEGKYTHGANGFVKLEYFQDGSSKATFYSEQDLNNDVQINVLSPLEEPGAPQSFPNVKQKNVEDVVLRDSNTYKKGGFYKFLWGERYRKYFGELVTAPVAYLDTLYGGLSVVKEGGGHQSFSLRLQDENGKQYAMRSLKKNALKFLKFQLPGIAYNQEDYRDTWAEEVISDFFTTAHPYMQLVINPMAKAVGINHSDSELYYIPKQEALGEHNDAFGDELYFVERRPSDEQLNYKGYIRTIDASGKITDFESTTDMLEKIKSDESYTIDQKNFIRARIFDMLIGDWDRHQDQWRWIQYERPSGDKEFMPVPRDRDNAFPRFDGHALKLIKLFVPTSRRWQTFDKDIDNVKWQNMAGNKLDRALLNKYGVDTWRTEAEIIQKQLTPEVIESAFERLPIEVQDETATFIKESLKARLKSIDADAVTYANYLNRIVTITGTEKDDLFEIGRMPKGRTKITVKRIFSEEKNEVIYERVFNRSETKEIWLYGLGDDDKFEVSGNGENAIKIRIVGGYGEDGYDITNKKRIKVYEWEHEDSEFDGEMPSTQMSDIYKTNSYHWRYFKPNTNILVPNLGFRTDDGIFTGLGDTYTVNGLNGNPFRQKHQLAANYYFGFGAVELKYRGIFGNVFPKWNLEVEGYYTSDRYAKNFFGLGNESVNAEDNLGRDFYRARTRQLKASVGIAYYSLRFKGLIESFRVNENSQRFFNPPNFNPEIFVNQTYVGGEVTGDYDRTDADDFPTKAIYIGLSAGYKYNLSLEDNKFGYASLKVGFDHKLIPSGDLVLGTVAEVKTNIGNNNFFFYHAPSLGGDNGLRGFRDERFSGRAYFYQSTDLKLRLKQYLTAVSPVTVGIYGGFDYGRVWVEDDTSNMWHTSQGGGFWISSLKALTFNIGYFNSRESNLVQVGFGLSF
ncbi:hypothetical protein GTQ34_07475 [Muricauda sp. JGD-17]|uniref:Haemolysin activator HlyB C-terminal domain-containing protein n=1 Tax=Flagellimonas ochracea TaxID=2696472 RepID=A0A964TBD2_9FLAO|nr:hypothetical protein [Allomuricauda ochracea]NAY91752.1 hypothetical protein [Allomuricauda ochracea]